MKRVYRILAILACILTPGIRILSTVFPIYMYRICYILLAILFILANIFPSLESFSIRTTRLKQCMCGAELLFIYLVSSIVNLVIFIVFIVRLRQQMYHLLDFLTYGFIALLLLIAAMFIVYCNGVIRIILFSSQVGVFYKGGAYFAGWLFPVNLFILPGIIKKARNEARFENNKLLINEQRAPMRICQTKYPLLMVHGVFFRDFKPAFLNYWGRITGELVQNGATVFTGNQQSAASVENCGQELADRIRQIVAQTGCEKVNIIAHSKGGLDSRAAIARYGVEDMVASLTTINTPHRGCEFADYLLGKFGQGFKDKVANTYNAALSKLGDQNPNFIEAVTDLTHEACTAFNERTPNSPKVYYQSVGTYMRHASGGKFPLNFSYHLVKHFDGRNDGLVGEKSFGWGQRFNFIEPVADRGISHGDMIDLNRENIDGFDVREFYVQLVNELKTMGF